MRRGKGAGEPTRGFGTGKRGTRQDYSPSAWRASLRILGGGVPARPAMARPHGPATVSGRANNHVRTAGLTTRRCLLELGPAPDQDPSRGRGELLRPAGASAAASGGGASAPPGFDGGAGPPNSFNGDGRGGLYFSVRGEILLSTFRFARPSMVIPTRPFTLSSGFYFHPDSEKNL
jgi:hypothetical protein